MACAAPGLRNGLPKDLRQFAHPPNLPPNLTYPPVALSSAIFHSRSNSLSCPIPILLLRHDTSATTTGYNHSPTLSPRLDLPEFWPGPRKEMRILALRTWFGLAPVNKLVSLTWLLWALRSFRRFTFIKMSGYHYHYRRLFWTLHYWYCYSNIVNYLYENCCSLLMIGASWVLQRATWVVAGCPVAMVLVPCSLRRCLRLARKVLWIDRYLLLLDLLRFASLNDSRTSIVS